MIKNSFHFSSSVVNYYFDASFAQLDKLASKQDAVIITDKNVFRNHEKKFKSWRTIVIPAGEEHKVQSTVDSVIQQLIETNADRQTILIGVGGGVVTDVTGYVAGIYMRGIRHGFIPTSLLAMVDAAIGGKCGIDVGVYKNMIGLIKQPAFILHDYSFLKTLPDEEWANGFAEIIKHACIKGAVLFKQLEQNNISFYRKDFKTLSSLVKRNAVLKTKVIMNDEFDAGERKLLNFGHTVGHAIENLYHIPHGFAVSIGIGAACRISEQVAGFKDIGKVINLLKRFQLPPYLDFDKEEILEVMAGDKKRHHDYLDYVVLQKIGQASVVPLSLEAIKEML